MRVSDFRRACRILEKAIFDHEETFMKQFTKMSGELIHVRFSSNTIEYVFIVDSGQHCVNGITWEDFIEWHTSTVYNKLS